VRNEGSLPMSVSPLAWRKSSLRTNSAGPPRSFIRVARSWGTKLMFVSGEGWRAAKELQLIFPD
jgi:hypothetical protein